MDSKITAPILLIAFNRPDTTEKVFQKIREARPLNLYVAVDGPRENKEGEFERVENVKQIVQKVDWECEAHYKYNEANLGAEITVSSAVTWALENEDYVIVLEDDIIAPLAFFNFAEQMLTRYANNENIYMISGGQFTPINVPCDYLFGIYGHTGCGWATWKRAWEKFDFYIDDFDPYLKGDLINTLVHSKEEKKYRQKSIQRMKEAGAGHNTWDACWSYIRFKEQGLSVIPRTNLTSNIGVFGLHAKGQTGHHFRSYDESFVVKNYPKEVYENVEYDKHHFETYLNRKTPLIQRIFHKALRILKLR